MRFSRQKAVQWLEQRAPMAVDEHTTLLFGFQARSLMIGLELERDTLLRLTEEKLSAAEKMGEAFLRIWSLDPMDFDTLFKRERGDS